MTQTNSSQVSTVHTAGHKLDLNIEAFASVSDRFQLSLNCTVMLISEKHSVAHQGIKAAKPVR